MAGSFDVFFSYSRRDRTAVEQVAQALAEEGLRVFLDSWELAPGQSWPRELERKLGQCNAVAIFVGQEGLSGWQQRERDLALVRQTREPGFPVIPVLLTHADPGLGFLELNTWIDLTADSDDRAAISILAAAVRRQPPGPSGRVYIEGLRTAICPYRGLRPFREEDEPFFFGRDRITETLSATLGRESFVAVVGASGSGKSSVVRAGLIPRLRRGAGESLWDALTLTPTDRPFVSLAAALLPALEPSLNKVERLVQVSKLATHLQDASLPLRNVTDQVLQQQPGTDRLLLCIDQWEELYTLCPDEAVRRTFVDQLLETASTERVRVVLTLRGDFMGHALANRSLSDKLERAFVPIGPMTRDELAATIVRPAEKTGLKFEPGLAGC